MAELEHDHEELAGMIDMIQAAARSPSFDLAGFERDLKAVKQACIFMAHGSLIEINGAESF